MYLIKNSELYINKKSNFLVYVFLFFCFIPYISPLPLSTDIQPTFIFFGILILISFSIRKYTSFEIIVFIFSIFYLVNISLDSTPDFFTYLRKNTSLLFIFPILVIVRKYYYMINDKFIKIILTFYISSILIEIFSPTIYSYYNLFSTQKIIDYGIRGISGVMPEPTDFAFTCFMLISIIFISKELHLISKRLYFISFLLLFLMILLSLSVAGVLSIILFIILINLRHIFSLKFFLFFSIFSIFVFISINYFENRVISILFNLVSNPMLVIENTSLFYRVLYNLIAIYNLYDSYGFGSFGVGAINHVGPYIIEKYDFFSIFPSRSEYLLSYSNGFGFSVKNIFAQLLLECGFVGIIFLIYIYYKIINGTIGLVRYVSLLSVSLCIVQSFPLIYPLLWIVISLAINYKNIKKKEINE